jgi:hypothetical protein
VVPVSWAASLETRAIGRHDLGLKNRPGFDVMITIFGDFRQFSAKNGVFLKNQCYDQNFA